MKQALGFVLMWIHCVALSSLASVTAENEGWPTALAVGAWIGGIVIGIFPILRTVALFSLLMFAMPWWQAVGATVVAAFILITLEQTGKKIAISR